MSLTLTLPWPPSTNSIWRSMRAGPMAGRVLLSKEGRQYRKDVYGAVREQNPEVIVFHERLGIEIVLHPPTRRKMDIDNRVKACLDALTHAGIWYDDEQIDVLIVRREEIRKEGAAIVRIWAEEAPERATNAERVPGKGVDSPKAENARTGFGDYGALIAPGAFR